MGGCSGRVTSLMWGYYKLGYASLEYSINGVLAASVSFDELKSIVRDCADALSVEASEELDAWARALDHRATPRAHPAVDALAKQPDAPRSQPAL